MPGDTTIILLLDGNNLAYHLYPHLSPGHKMTAEDGQRLVEHLAAYGRDNVGFAVELCLDRSPGVLPLLPANLRVLHAEYPQTGDDLLIDRFWFHQVSHHPCLVVTNDGAILTEVADAGGNSLRVYDFVRRVGLENPVLRPYEELPPLHRPVEEIGDQPFSLNTSIYFRLVEDPRLHRARDMKPGLSASKEPMIAGLELSQDEPAASIAAETADYPSAEEISTPKLSQPASGIHEGHQYLLTIDSWPVMEGARFLVNAFCYGHRAEYWDLISSIDPQTLSHADLRALAELLLHACGQEPDFARRGSLLDRVRLALLQAGGEPLSLNEVSHTTGLKTHGLHGRIKSKSGNWLIFG
jgi:hypothetical protein